MLKAVFVVPKYLLILSFFVQKLSVIFLYIYFNLLLFYFIYFLSFYSFSYWIETEKSRQEGKRLRDTWTLLWHSQSFPLQVGDRGLNPVPWAYLAPLLIYLFKNKFCVKKSVFLQHMWCWVSNLKVHASKPSTITTAPHTPTSTVLYLRSNSIITNELMIDV